MSWDYQNIRAYLFKLQEQLNIEHNHGWHFLCSHVDIFSSWGWRQGVIICCYYRSSFWTDLTLVDTSSEVTSYSWSTNVSISTNMIALLIWISAVFQHSAGRRKLFHESIVCGELKSELHLVFGVQEFAPFLSIDACGNTNTRTYVVMKTALLWRQPLHGNVPWELLFLNGKCGMRKLLIANYSQLQ